jgi:carboxymethylenebutenolidase
MCFDDDARPPIPVIADSGARGEGLHLTSSDGTCFAAYLANPGDAPGAQVMIFPDVRGLHQFYRELGMRFAEIGIKTLAIDYFARTAPNDDRTDSFEYMEHAKSMTPESFDRDLNAALEYLRRDGDPRLPTFTLGFCMGGALSYRAGKTRDDLTGVVAFYGGVRRSLGAVTPAMDWADEIKCPVLALYGGEDQGIPQEDVDAFERKLDAGNVPHEIVVYPGAPHSFFDRRATDFATASADAWTRVQDFIASYSPSRV